MVASLSTLPGDEASLRPITNGAIYQGSMQGPGLQLFRDHRVWQIGDLVTVQIAQNAVAAKNVSQNIGRSDATTSTVNNLFGLPTSFGHSSRSTQFNPNIDYNSANTLQGSGATAQANHWVNADLLPGVKVNVNAMVRLTQLEQSGFTLIYQ